jgi:hypothetical protein
MEIAFITWSMLVGMFLVFRAEEGKATRRRDSATDHQSDDLSGIRVSKDHISQPLRMPALGRSARKRDAECGVFLSIRI